MRIRNLLGWLVVVVLIGSFIYGLFNAQGIADWLKLRGYEPSARVVELADNTTMTDSTKRVFYINHPKLDSKEEFNGHCYDTSAEQTIVLGCFIENQGIYLLNVTDSRLNGVVEVTAAHEVLHAMYERLSRAERERVDKMTQAFFATVKDERIIKTVDNYRKKDASIVPNELHSILATEIRDLSLELEEYYSRYFKDRKKIVEYSEDYEQVFLDLESQAQEYDERLEDLKRRIDLETEQLNVIAEDINQKRQDIENNRPNNGSSSAEIDEYNNKVDEFNALIEEYNQLVNQRRQTVVIYNDLIDERNKLSIQRQQLYEIIDSNKLDQEQQRLE